MIYLESILSSNEAEALAFLKKQEDESILLLGNLHAYGPYPGESPNSGQFKLVRQNGEIIAIFCLSLRGILLFHSVVINNELFDLIIKACKEEPITLVGVIGQWSCCAALWDYLKLKSVISKENYVPRQVLYTLETGGDRLFTQGDSRARLLQEQDFADWHQLSLEYIQEQHLPKELNADQAKEQFLWKVKRKQVWGLFKNHTLVAVAELNAQAVDIALLGGVYTTPKERKKGLAKALISQLIKECQTLFGLRKLLIFTDEHNGAARKAYTGLGAKEIGPFAVFFGEG